MKDNSIFSSCSKKIGTSAKLVLSMVTDPLFLCSLGTAHIMYNVFKAVSMVTGNDHNMMFRGLLNIDNIQEQIEQIRNDCERP